jgi:hypothetical protein
MVAGSLREGALDSSRAPPGGQAKKARAGEKMKNGGKGKKS